MSDKNKEKLCRLTPAEINSLPGKEVKSKRTRSSKTYSLGNGLYQAVVYPEAVHYRNEKGEWEDIDHTLQQADGSLCDHSGDLAADLGPGGCVTLRKGEHTLSWQIVGANAVKPAVENTRCRFPRHNENRCVENRVTYANIFPDVDFVCDLKPNQFKDTLIFKTPSALRPVKYMLRAEGLVLHQAASGTVVAMCGDDTIFRLPAPSVVNENGEPIQDSVRSVLTQTGEHDWILTCEVDAAFAASASWPVRLDPVVETEQTTSAMSMAYTARLKPDTTYSGNSYSIPLTYGNSSFGETYAYLRFEDSSLPEIDSSYYVTSAEMTMCTAYAGSDTGVYVTEVLEDWDASNITYNNSPAVADEPLEYSPSYTYAGWYLTFNIANLVRKWYDGENHGMKLDIRSNGTVHLIAAGAQYNKPFITINYVSLAGLESYLTQDTIGCGRAGTAHVGLFNGNLVLSHQETAMNGNLMPVSVSRYYNSCYRDVNPFGVGYGWKLSTQQTLHKETLDSTTYYVYMDGDGTRHHFKQISGEWKDLSGLDLTLTISGSTATITDKGDNKMVFALPTAEFADNYANVKLIQSASDACGNTATFAHNTNRVFTSVTDGAARTTAGTVSSGLLTSITAPGMPAVSYSYTSGNLTGITHEDGKATTYAYNSLNLPTTITNHDGTALQIEYTSKSPYRVKQVTMLAGGSAYAGRKYTYGNCCTKMTELYPNASGGLSEGKSLHYHFNDAGNLVSVNDELGYGCFAGYSDDMPANHPAFVSKMQKAVNNYLDNHHFLDSTSTSWVGDLMDGTGECAYNSEMNYAGGRAYRLKKTSSTGRVGVYQTLSLTKGRSYTFSCQYKTLNSATAQLRIEWKNSAGVTQYAESSAQASTDRWNRNHVSFTLPSDAASAVTVRIMAAGGAGTVWADAAQLEDGMVPNRYNLLENGNFYMNSSGIPQCWLGSDDLTSADGVTDQVAAGRPSDLTGNVMRIYGEPGTQKEIYQEMSCIGEQGDTFVAGGWSFSHCKPRDAADISRYHMEIRFQPLAEDVGITDGTIPTFQTLARVLWSEEWSGWQFAATPIVTPWRYTAVAVVLVYRGNLNEAQFSNVFLHKEEFGNTYAYDGNGNVTSVTNLASLKSGSEYDSFDNLISYHQPGRSEEYTLNWGSTDAQKKQHLLRSVTSPMNYVQKTAYDVDDSSVSSPKGLPVQSSLENSAGSRKIVSKVEYTANKNYVSKQTDARGKSVTTTTDANKGWVTSVTDPKGQAVNYTHDTLGRVTAVTATADGKTYRNAYTYDGDKLTQVAYNTGSDSTCDVTYHFAYDSQNRRTTVKVGTQLLSENVYNTTKGDIKHGTLTKSKFGNGGEVRYTYDDFKRVTGIQYDTDTTDRYKFEYGANGQLARVTDNLLNRTTLSEYDVSNRPMRKTTVEGATNVYLGEVTYDEYSNLASFREQVGSARTAYRTDFTYDTENKPTKLTYGSTSNQVVYAYDDIGRMTTRTATVGGRAYAATYGYTAGGHGTGSTTGLIASISQTGGNFTYTYDDNGNITSVVQDGVTTTYTYDGLGQLIRVDDGHENATWVYEYDRGGNITSKSKYALGVTSGTPVESKTFTYGNSNWKDQLTAVNGTAITYDAIGNPTSDGTWTYTWEKGRQLKSMAKSGETVTFKYNSDGLRVQKVATSTGTTNYTLHGKNIVHMTQGSNSLHFFYDASNKPAIVDFNGTKYAYVHNLQGDIVAILDSNGSVVVQYKYDAWGRIISKTGSLASTLGTVQPFRYRGYVFDEETGLYYLCNRFYHNTWGRFLNSDAIIGSVGAVFSSNLWIYCDNNVINGIDQDGLEMNLVQPYVMNHCIGIKDVGGGGGGALAICGVAWLSKLWSKAVHFAQQVAIVLFPTAMYTSGLVNTGDASDTDTISVRAGASPYNQEQLQAIEATVQAMQLSALEIQGVTLPWTLKLRFRNDFHIHHIVPQKAAGALPARAILYSVYPAGVNAPENLVLLPARQHNSMHTATYIHYVNQQVIHAFIGHPEGRTERVTNVLNTLRIELIGASLLFY